MSTDHFSRDSVSLRHGNGNAQTKAGLTTQSDCNFFASV